MFGDNVFTNIVCREYCKSRGYMDYIQGNLQRRKGHLKYPEEYSVPLATTEEGRLFTDRKVDVSTKWVQKCVEARRAAAENDADESGSGEEDVE